jgi:hypothetical protein
VNHEVLSHFALLAYGTPFRELRALCGPQGYPGVYRLEPVQIVGETRKWDKMLIFMMLIFIELFTYFVQNLHWGGAELPSKTPDNHHVETLVLRPYFCEIERYQERM